MTSSLDQIDKAINTGKIAGSWLIIGGDDYDRKSFVLNTCSKLFHQDFNDVNTFHPDLKWLECGLTEEAKKEVQKTILAGKAVTDMSDLSRRREITVDDVRAGIQFLSLKSAPDHWRVLVVDPVDKMNENAANALLKGLEEPGERCIIFLLCRNLGKILPTIKSRCRLVKLTPLPPTVLAAELHRLYPQLEDINTVVALSEGSIGFARLICENDGLSLYQQMMELFQPISQLSVDAVKSFVAAVADDDVAFELFRHFLADWFVQQVRANAIQAPFLAEDYMDLYQEATSLLTDIDRIYLDKRQVIQSIFFKIAEVLS